MARSLRAFVSYRRSDAFMQGPDTGRPNLAFIEQLRLALEHLGFNDVFIDTAEMLPGDLFEDRIHRSIVECDLFIPLIGHHWLRLLREKIESGETDILLQELATAIALEKDIVPLLIDGAPVPHPGDLPDGIRQLPSIDAKSLPSNATAEIIATALRGSVQAASGVRKLGRGWATAYVSYAAVTWVFSGIVTNAVGFNEFGYESWTGMMAAWSGFFIWPFFFMPLVFFALYRPFQILVEATLNARSLGDALTYASPILIGTVIAVGMTVVEASPPQVPWTIHPKLHADCRGPPDPGPADPTLRAEYERDRETLGTYGATGAVPTHYRSQFWMKDKCWPNVFFYMTVPLRGAVIDEAYKIERAKVGEAFLRILAVESKSLKGTDAPFSVLFPFYALSFFLMIWVLAIAILMAAIYAVVSIRRPRDGRVLRVPNEDAFLCLMHAFITLMVWIPFRMMTNATKFAYNCDIIEDCRPGPEVFMKDGPFVGALLFGYVCLTIGMLWNHKRLLLGFLGTLLVGLVSISALVVARYHDTIVRVGEFVQFWVAISLLATVILATLWYQFSPALVRFRDFQERLKTRGNR